MTILLMRRLMKRNRALRRFYILLRSRFTPAFIGSKDYWENYYLSVGNAGPGSANDLARFKAEILNGLVDKHRCQTVIEFGCGDGMQLALATYKYIGVGISKAAVRRCQKLYSEDRTKLFLTIDEYSGQKAELALSLDVIFHLIEDDVYITYMEALFNAATSRVVVYASNQEDLGFASLHMFVIVASWVG